MWHRNNGSSFILHKYPFSRLISNLERLHLDSRDNTLNSLYEMRLKFSFSLFPWVNWKHIQFSLSNKWTFQISKDVSLQVSMRFFAIVLLFLFLIWKKSFKPSLFRKKILKCNGKKIKCVPEDWWFYFWDFKIKFSSFFFFKHIRQA